MKPTHRTLAFVVGTLVLIVGSPAYAQVLPTATSGNSIRSRADLEALILEYEDVLASSAYSDELKSDVRVKIELTRNRLEFGDFRVGDAVILRVQGEPGLPDTLVVESGPDGPLLVLPAFGTVRLYGVLRSELEERITAELSRFIRNPIVRAEGLMRLSVQGAVGQPGFYVVPADILISQALMVAGGPAQNAALDQLRIERGPETLLDGGDLQEELRLGSTLDQLNLQAGDQLVLPVEDTIGGGWFRNVGVVLGLATSITLVISRLGGL